MAAPFPLIRHVSEAHLDSFADYRLALMISMASSSVSATTTQSTGPKISFLSHQRFSMWLDPLIRLHIRCHLDDRRSDEVAFRVVRYRTTSAIKQDFAAFLVDRIDEPFDTLLSCCGDDGSTTIVSAP